MPEPRPDVPYSANRIRTSLNAQCMAIMPPVKDCILTMLLVDCSSTPGTPKGMLFERRSADRKAVNTRAIVVWGNDLMRAFAVILDISETGLRIRLDHETEIAGDGYILFDHRMEPFRVAWQANRSAGLQFTMPSEA